MDSSCTPLGIRIRASNSDDQLGHLHEPCTPEGREETGTQAGLGSRRQSGSGCDFLDDEGLLMPPRSSAPLHQHRVAPMKSRLSFRARLKLHLRKLGTPAVLSAGQGVKNEVCGGLQREEMRRRNTCPGGRDNIPRKKRSNLGMVFVRISPRFSIRDLPRMYEDFKRSRGDAEQRRQRKISWDLDRAQPSMAGKVCRRKRTGPAPNAFFRCVKTSLKKRALDTHISAIGDASIVLGMSRPPATSGTRPPNYSCMREMFAKRQWLRGSSRVRSPRCDAFQSFFWNRDDGRDVAGALADADPGADAASDQKVDGIAGVLPDHSKLGGSFPFADLAHMQRCGAFPRAEPHWKARPGVCSPDIPKTCAPKASQIIAVLMKANLLTLGEKLQYKTKHGQLLAEGWVMWNGILCSRCGGVVGPTGFERCAGSLARRPCDHIFTHSGQTLHSAYKMLGLGQQIEGGPSSPEEEGSREVVTMDGVAMESQLGDLVISS
ncbi:unnamed protein product [Ostreobium quekettii]|uniref:Tify domain-containing protein n=1 Tax=Ostreobium quekettii TaxID=121088 RepID=A0A8S1J2B1_9CHLO|nr:unnamed protein product [Ostreobium quekettii]